MTSSLLIIPFTLFLIILLYYFIVHPLHNFLGFRFLFYFISSVTLFHFHINYVSQKIFYPLHTYLYTAVFVPNSKAHDAETKSRHLTLPAASAHFVTRVGYKDFRVTLSILKNFKSNIKNVINELAHP